MSSSRPSWRPRTPASSRNTLAALCRVHRQEIQTAYLESYSEYGQNIFDRYVTYADYWIQDNEYRDTDTGEVFDRSRAQRGAGKIEKPAGIANPKDFRNEIVNFVLARVPTTRARTRAGPATRSCAW